MSVRYIIKNKKRGFTLIEMMVSVTIFSIVTLIVSGAFIVLADIYRQIQSNRAVIDNLNLAMDTIALQIKEGQNYEILENGSGLSFREYIIEDNEFKLGRYLTYRIKEGSNGILEQCTTLDRDECNDLTSSEINMETLSFELLENTAPVLIRIVMEGVALSKENTQSKFLLQSTLSQRNY